MRIASTLLLIAGAVMALIVASGAFLARAQPSTPPFWIPLPFISAVAGATPNPTPTATPTGPQPPQTGDDNFTIQQGETLIVEPGSGVLANDTSPGGKALRAVLVSAPAAGALDLRQDGSFTYTPIDGFAGLDTFTYRADDGQAASSPATVTIEVTQPVNAPPRFVTGRVAFSKRVIGTGVLGTHIALGADLDRDGDMDVVATDYENSRVLWYENDGQGAFTERLLDGDLAGAYPAAIGDIDLDGNSDVLAAGYLAETFVWYRNDGGGAFTRFDIDTQSDGAHSIVPVDLDRDGDTIS